MSKISNARFAMPTRNFYVGPKRELVAVKGRKYPIFARVDGQTAIQAERGEFFGWIMDEELIFCELTR